MGFSEEDASYEKLDMLPSKPFRVAYRVKDADGNFLRLEELRALDWSNSLLDSLEAISHPHIVKYHSHWANREKLSIVMDLCIQTTLADVQANTVPLQVILLLCEQLANGLRHLNVRRVVHGSLRPDVIFTFMKTLKIGGFDVTARKSKTMMGRAISGALECTCPQVLQGKPEIYESDVWAFGCIVYKLLMGHAPYSPTIRTAENDVVLMKSRCFLPLKPDTPPALADLLNKILSFEPRDRPNIESIHKFFIQLNKDLQPTITRDTDIHSESKSDLNVNVEELVTSMVKSLQASHMAAKDVRSILTNIRRFSKKHSGSLLMVGKAGIFDALGDFMGVGSFAHRTVEEIQDTCPMEIFSFGVWLLQASDAEGCYEDMKNFCVASSFPQAVRLTSSLSKNAMQTSLYEEFLY
eukprot:Rmarinus@m.19638